MRIDVTTVNRFLKGDTSALKCLIESEGAGLERFIRSYIRSSDTAEDVFQETWIRVWQKKNQLKNAEQFKYWLFQIARNKAYDALKKQNMALSINLFGDMEDEILGFKSNQMNPREIAQVKEWRRILNSEISQLNAVQQEMLALRYYSEFSLQQISDTLNIPLGTVCVTMSRVLAKLRKQLEDSGYFVNANIIWIERDTGA